MTVPCYTTEVKGFHHHHDHHHHHPQVQMYYYFKCFTIKLLKIACICHLYNEIFSLYSEHYFYEVFDVKNAIYGQALVNYCANHFLSKEFR